MLSRHDVARRRGTGLVTGLAGPCVAAHDAVVYVPCAGTIAALYAHAWIGARHAGARGDALTASIRDKASGARRRRGLTGTDWIG